MKMDVLAKNVEKIKLKEAMTLEQIYDLMMENPEKMPGKFKLKKGIFGKSILFDVVMQTQPRITVKDNIVTVRRMGNSTTVGVGNMPGIDFKSLKQRTKAVKEGGFSKAISGGAEYFGSVCDVMVDLLQTHAE